MMTFCVHLLSLFLDSPYSASTHYHPYMHIKSRLLAHCRAGRVFEMLCVCYFLIVVKDDIRSKRVDESSYERWCREYGLKLEIHALRAAGGKLPWE